MIRILAPVVFAPLLVIGALGCSQPPAPKPIDGSSGAPRGGNASDRRAHPADRSLPRADAGVTITIDVDRARFAPGTEVNVSVMNQKNIESQRSAGSCMVGFSDAPVNIPCPDGFSCTSTPDRPNEITICPPGVTPRAPLPVESFTFAQASIDGAVTFTARSLVQGEPYEISIGGLAADGCNSVGATMKGTLEGATMTFHPQGWAQTEMACP